MRIQNDTDVTGCGEHKKNEQAKAGLIERLKGNAETIRGNVSAVSAANKDLSIKAIEQELRRRKAEKKDEKFEEPRVGRVNYSGPGESTAASMDEMVDCLELLTGDAVSEGYVPRDLLRKVASFDVKKANTAPIHVNIA